MRPLMNGSPSRPPCLTDSSDQQWRLIEPLLPAAKPGGRPRPVDLREVVDTLLYLIRSGCRWVLPPHELSSEGTACRPFCRWRDDGTLQSIVVRCGGGCAP